MDAALEEGYWDGFVLYVGLTPQLQKGTVGFIPTARMKAGLDGEEEMSELHHSVAKWGPQAILTPLALVAARAQQKSNLFDRSGEASHRCTTCQAIEEGFLFDEVANEAKLATHPFQPAEGHQGPRLHQTSNKTMLRGH